jgi:hypothetical protein
MLDLRPSHLAAAAVSLALNNPDLPKKRLKRAPYTLVPTVPGVVRTTIASVSTFDYT